MMPSARLKVMIKKEAKAAEIIFELSPIPKIIMNNGKSAVAGVDLKKSSMYEVAEYNFLNLPRTSPEGTAISIDSMNDSVTLYTELKISFWDSFKTLGTTFMISKIEGIRK
jgi:hypothetical protein